MQEDYLNENYDEEIEDAFNLFDKDRSKSISAKELSQVFVSLGYNFTEDEIK